ncbi:hypothetical protein ANN_03940 [Periplaneta americana]|uniref:Uncharacterized protein n=1 Tax=Periplaneta americana TaxID=6978 RepID=A0ABQ8T8N0_PERAM|nr:hypothetical protein ANN_03940 [Periplaneta americana]
METIFRKENFTRATRSSCMDMQISKEMMKVAPGKIVCLDETWVNAGITRSRSWTDDTVPGTMNTQIGKGIRLILFHASTMEGFIPNTLLLVSSKKTVV